MKSLCILFASFMGITTMGGIADGQEPDYGDLPVAITSFGATVDGGSLFVYGGNASDAHHYYREGQNNKLWRLDLKQGGEWKTIAEGPYLQGLALVADEGKIYRLGGLMALNDKEEDQELESTDEVACLDPAKGDWSELPPLPEPRSSFDAAVLDHVIYVIGGWQLENGNEHWLETAYKLDLKADEPKWEKIANPPHVRRANSVGTHGNVVVSVGGMGEVGGPSKGVMVYHPQSDQWTEGPEVPGEAMDGFGTAAFRVGDALCVSTVSGQLLRLNDDATAWEKLTPVETGRFFHRMVPVDSNHVLIVGGTAMRGGKLKSVELVELKQQ